MHISAEGYSMHHLALQGCVLGKSPGPALVHNVVFLTHSIFKYIMKKESAPTGVIEENSDQN